VFHDQEQLFIVPKANVEKLAQKLNNILENPLLLDKVGNNARQYIKEKFDIKKNTAKLTEILKDAIKTKG
jgi:glycosyltransferase involved in cell wall biosynthesis